MTFLDIETFLAVVKYGNLSTAAQNLFISQPALTRRLQYLEQELGYPLIVRQKGHRTIQLTEQGTKFYRIAWKWQLLWEETNLISFSGEKEVLSVASVNSVGRYLLSPVFPEFLSHRYHLRLYNAFSEDAYLHMEHGLFDLAFIEQQDFTYNNSHDIFTKPAFSESFVVASYCELPTDNGVVDIQSLKAEQEIYVPWNNEFKFWHSNCFPDHLSPVVFLEDISLLESFLLEDRWIVVPAAMGRHLESTGAHIYHLNNSPPDRIIYYLTRANNKDAAISLLISLLNNYLCTHFHEEITPLLSIE